MTAGLLVDKSAWARTSVPVVADALDRLSSESRLYTCSITDLEVLYSARNAEDHRAIRLELRGLERIELDQDAFDRAVEVQALLAQTGHHRRPIPDLIIAAVAEHNRLTILHYDRDFEIIARVTGQRHQWVAEPGSI